MMNYTDGALNERFCLDKEHNLLLTSKTLQVADINLQYRLGKLKKYALQKVNWPNLNKLSSKEQNDYGKYCYALLT